MSIISPSLIGRSNDRRAGAVDAFIALHLHPVGMYSTALPASRTFVNAIVSFTMTCRSLLSNCYLTKLCANVKATAMLDVDGNDEAQ